MNRLQRLTAILVHLQSKRMIKASEVAKKFNISLRTVYRDIRSLEEAGVPIGAETGKGYFITDGYHIPPVMFTNTEAAALLMGEKLVEKLTDASLQKQYSSALTKIKSVLPDKHKGSMEDLDTAIYIFKAPRPAIDNSSSPWLSQIQEAIMEKIEIKMNYFSIYSKESTDRCVQPIGLCHYGNAWHLISYCLLRKDFRDFRVDRIKSIQLTDKKFLMNQKSAFEKYVNNLSCSEHLIQTTIRFNKSIVKYIHDQKFSYGFIDEKECENFVEMTFLTSSLEYFARWLMICGTTADIVSPYELKEHMSKLSRKTYDHFQSQLSGVLLNNDDNYLI